MTEKTIKVGATVRLVAGGPLMFVKSVDGEEAVTVWFEGSTKLEKSFPLSDLKLDDGGLANG